MAKLQFNAAEVEPQKAFEPLPSGWYNVQIEESEMRDASTQGNEYLELKMKVLDGDFANRVIYDRLNIINSSEVAQAIAYEQLSAICHATGVINVEDTDELHGKPFMAKVKLKPANGDYEAGNDVKGYKACDGSESQGGKASSASAAASGMPADGPSWATKETQPAAQASSDEPPVATDKPAAKPPAKKPAPAPKPAAEPEYIMKGEAEGYTRQEMHDAGWTDEDLLDNNMMEVIEPEPEKKAPPAKKMPPKKAAPAASTEAASDSTPPWAKK